LPAFLNTLGAFKPDIVVLAGIVLTDRLIARPPTAELKRALSNCLVVLDPAFRVGWSMADWQRHLLPWMKIVSVFAPSAAELRALTGLPYSAASKARKLLGLDRMCVKEGRQNP
jgi:sugar/nucleoside kinase (ribokinase family)